MNRALEGAKRKGKLAFKEGQPKSSCPYPDWRTIGHGHVTWSRSFRTAWFEGWEEAEKEAGTK